MSQFLRKHTETLHISIHTHVHICTLPLFHLDIQASPRILHFKSESFIVISVSTHLLLVLFCVSESNWTADQGKDSFCQYFLRRRQEASLARLRDSNSGDVSCMAPSVFNQGSRMERRFPGKDILRTGLCIALLFDGQASFWGLP